MSSIYNQPFQSYRSQQLVRITLLRSAQPKERRYCGTMEDTLKFCRHLLKRL